MKNESNEPQTSFSAEITENISKYPQNEAWQELSSAWMVEAFRNRYMYNFSWQGRPIIQTPVDMVATQEVIWQVKPDLIIETGIAHGGSLLMSAAMLALIDYCDAVSAGKILDPKATQRWVLGLDIDIRAHNRAAIEEHPMSHRITMIEGSSIDPMVIDQVRTFAKSYKRILVFLDSNHTHDHVLAELEAYAPLVSVDSYCVVFDTVVEDMPSDMFPDRPWSPGNNPKTAVREFLRAHSEFTVDKNIDNKLMISVAPEGYLKRQR